ncbi:hypothetical protein [Lysinibacillus sp. 54212]|uniref:hypothetical protein n=1 Tax=Lysinibacillus sp. 54212 TaxID=3119829 RepID=UPI002FC5813E
MNKEKLMKMMTIGVALTLISIFLFVFGVEIGTGLTDMWRRGNAGVIDSVSYTIRLEGTINNFLVVGGICLFIGLVTMIITYYKLLCLEEK